jgi:hypothetical protein
MFRRDCLVEEQQATPVATEANPGLIPLILYLDGGTSNPIAHM